MDLLLGSFVKKYVNTFNYNELLDLYEILENDDDIILKWYFNNTNVKIIKRNNVSNLLKKFKL